MRARLHREVNQTSPKVCKLGVKSDEIEPGQTKFALVESTIAAILQTLATPTACSLLDDVSPTPFCTCLIVADAYRRTLPPITSTTMPYCHVFPLKY